MEKHAQILMNAVQILAMLMLHVIITMAPLNVNASLDLMEMVSIAQIAMNV